MKNVLICVVNKFEHFQSGSGRAKKNPTTFVLPLLYWMYFRPIPSREDEQFLFQYHSRFSLYFLYDISITVDFILAFTKCLHIIFIKNFTLLIACLLDLQ